MFFLSLTIVLFSTTSLLVSQDNQAKGVTASAKCGPKAPPAKAVVSSRAGQTNGIDVATQNSFLDAGTDTNAKGDGSVKSRNRDPKASSDTNADGNTNAKIVNTPDKSSVQATTHGASDGTVKLEGNGKKNSNTVAKGSGTLNAGVFQGGGPTDDFSAGTTISGTGQYAAHSPTSASGSTDITGGASTQRTATPNGEKISTSGQVQSCTTATAQPAKKGGH